MSRLLIIACLSFLFYVPTVDAVASQRIVDISIEGNRYVETDAVLNRISIQVGDMLNRRQISREVRRLFATGFFSDIHAEGERVDGGIKLIFIVVENPVIASVKLEGYDKLSKKKIRPLLQLKAGRVISPRIEQEDINSIRKSYLKKGFYQAKVNIQTKLRDDGRVDVTVDIIEGAITHVKEIQFVGNERFSSDELTGLLATSASSLGSWFTDRDVFNRDRFAADAQLIQQYYLEHGYLDIKVESTRLMLTPNMDDFYLGMSLSEGEVYTVTGVVLQGDLVPSKEKLEESIKLEVGELYALSNMQKTLVQLTETVGDEGFAFANVTPTFHRNIKEHTVEIVFDIEKGREVYVERIQFSGHDKTKDHVIRRELRQHEGERYKASAVRRSQERLRRLSYMKNVSIAKSNTASPQKINLDVDVEEGKSGKFSAGISYSQIYGVGFQGSVSEENLFGGGYRTSLTADVGGRVNNYKLNFTDPYLFKDGVSGTFSIFQNQTDPQSFALYTQNAKGGSLGLGFELNEHMRYSINYSISETTLSGVPATSSFALRSQEGTFTNGELTQSISYDTRNRTIYPSTGGIQSVSFGFAGLTGDRKFYETTLSSRNYYELSDVWTLRILAGLGNIRGYSGLDAPVYRRYSLGGVSTIRGYDSFGVSLVDPVTLDVVGGTSKATSSLDLIFPLPYMENEGFRGSFFVDAGTVWGNSGTVSESFIASHIRGSYGFGIEWNSPVGPLTLTWGYSINRQTNDKVRKFELGLGQGF